LLRTNIGLNIITKTFSKKLKPFLRMFMVSRCVDSPNIAPAMGVTIRSWILGFSAVASIKYSQINDWAVAKRKE
jgi:hypothetical protein